MLPECNPTASLRVIAAEYGYVETDPSATDEAKRYRAVCKAAADGDEAAVQAVTQVARETRPVAVEESMLQTDAAAVGAASTIFHEAFTPRVSGSSQARRLPK